MAVRRVKQRRSYKSPTRERQQLGNFPPRMQAFLETQTVRYLSGGSRVAQRTLNGLSDLLTKGLELEFGHAKPPDVTPNHVKQILENLRKHSAYNPVLVERDELHVYELSTSFEPGRRRKIAVDEVVCESVPFPYTLLSAKPSDFSIFAAVGNTEIGNKGQRLDALHTFYELAARQGVRAVFHTGDLIAGKPNNDNRGEINFETLNEQATYFAKNYPRIPGVKTYFITGKDKEGSFHTGDKRESGMVLQFAAEDQGRDDLRYLGHEAAEIEIPVGNDSLELRLMHLRGNTWYAQSYPAQTANRAIQSGNKPDMIIYGHAQFMEHFPEREMWALQAGGFVDQTPSMEARRKKATVGGQIYVVTKAAQPPGDARTHRFDLVVQNVDFYSKQWHVQNHLVKR